MARITLPKEIWYGEDKELSLKDKGTLLVSIMLLNQKINPTVENIKNSSTDAETSIRTSIKNLTQLGYYKAIKYRVEDGAGFNWRYEVNEWKHEVQE